MITGFICSAFDLCHAGHILMLKECKQNCDKLIVALHSDPTIDRPKKNSPIQTLVERMIKLEAIKYIDEIIVYDTEYQLENILLTLNPDIRFLGTDYIGKKFTGDDMDIDIIYIDRSHGYSTSELRKRVWRAENEIANIKRDS